MATAFCYPYGLIVVRSGREKPPTEALPFAHGTTARLSEVLNAEARHSDLDDYCLFVPGVSEAVTMRAAERALVKFMDQIAKLPGIEIVSHRLSRRAA